jgi:hypothetical protein
MIRRLTLILSMAAISAHADPPNLQSIDELRRVVHVQSELISELSGRVQVLEKSLSGLSDRIQVVEKGTATTMEVEDKALQNANKVTHVLQQEIDRLSARLSKVEK